MNYLSTVVSLLAIIYCLGCCPDKETPGLPPVTSEGKNTFACKINGEVFVADGSGTDTPNKGIYAVLEDNGDGIGNFLPPDSCSLVLRASEGTCKLYFYINPYLGNAKHDLRFNTDEFPAIVRPFNYGRIFRNGKNYITNSIDTGSVFISKWDKDKRIISGTFQFRAKNLTNKTDIVEVTEGRFDLDYSKTH